MAFITQLTQKYSHQCHQFLQFIYSTPPLSNLFIDSWAEEAEDVDGTDWGTKYADDGVYIVKELGVSRVPAEISCKG